MKINLPRLRRIGAFAIIAAMLLALFPYGRIPVMAAQSAPQQDATEFESGLAPEEYDLVYPKLSQFRAEASAESSKYDARDDGFVSPVRNQGTNSLCWAFATYGLAEANMLKNGLGTQDLSEMHLAYSTSNHSGNTAQGFDRAPGDGGNRFFASTYLMRGTNLSGAVNESVDPYSIFGLPDRALATTQGKAKSFTVRNILFLSDVKGSITNSTIKEEIVNNGAVAASMYWDGTATSDAGSGSTLYYNAPNAAYLYDGEPADTNHAVLIVGWDDAYPIANFNEGHRPTSNGAWLIKNSWGDGWGLDGYFWISYQDASFPLQTYTLDGVELYDASLKIYEHDYKWNGATAGGFTIGNTYARVFTVGSANETLKSVKLAFAQPVQNIEIDVITNFSPTGSYTMNPDMKVSTAFPGWHTFDFDIPIPLGAAGSKFAIVIKYAGYGWMGYDVSNAAADGTAYRWNVNSGAWESQTLGYAIKGVATAMTDEAAVAAAKSSLTWNLIKGENPSQTSIRTNLVLPSSVGYGTSISWSSSNSAITSSGVVNRKDVNSQGNFIATITKGAASAQATFDLTVIGVPTADVDAVNSAASKITWDSVKNANTLINAVTTSLSALPSNISGVAATWVSSNPSYLANNGAVTRPRFDKGDQDAVLTATLTKGEATKTASLNLKILAKEQTDDDSAQAVRDNLTFSTYWSIVRGENAAIEEVRYDLTVPTKGDYDTEAYGRARLSDGSVWSAITDEGKVIRPAYGQANTSGYFYLYFRKGSSMSYSRGWILTVLSYKGTVKINAQPADQTLAVGETKNLSVAGGANQGTPGSMRYQWYSNTAKSATGGTKIDGATSETYALPAGLAQGKYY
ncbi:MAG: hypothetical protein LBC41_01070, partial [Clostridiales bacterium]|nr:hypothetical protein [Clostridiales bacterium]